MIKYQNTPNALILDCSDIIKDCQRLLDESWLFTVDLEFILQNMFNCFVNVQDVESVFNKTLYWLKTEGLEFKSDNTENQISYILDVINKTMQNILSYVISIGYFEFGTFPYEFKELLPDKSILLTKINNFTSLSEI